MADIDTPLGAADQTLAFTLVWLVAEPVFHVRDTQLAIGVLAEVLPHVDRDHPIVGPMARAADQIVDIGGPRQQAGGITWAGAMFDAARAVARFGQWRAGRSRDALQKQREKTA